MNSNKLLYFLEAGYNPALEHFMFLIPLQTPRYKLTNIIMTMPKSMLDNSYFFI